MKKTRNYPTVAIANQAMENVIRDWLNRNDKLELEVVRNVQNVINAAWKTADEHELLEATDYIEEIYRQFNELCLCIFAVKNNLRPPYLTANTNYEKRRFLSFVCARGQLNRRYAKRPQRV